MILQPFLLFYVISMALGAGLIFAAPDYAIQFNSELDPFLIRIPNLSGLVILFLPFILFSPFVRKILAPKTVKFSFFNPDLGKLHWIISFLWFGFFAYSVLTFPYSFAETYSAFQDYKKFIQLRGEMYEYYGYVHYVVLYTIAPLVMGHYVFCSRNKRFALVIYLFLASYMILTLLTFQKAPIMVMGLFFIYAKFLVGKFRLFGAGLIASALFLFFFGVQYLVLGGAWKLESNIVHVFTRMAWGSISAVNTYGVYLNYEGLDFPLKAASSEVSITLHQLLYPSNETSFGRVPVPAHIQAFAEGGVVYSVFLQIVLATLFAYFPVRKVHNDYFKFLIMIMLVVFSYYLAQVSLLNALYASMGVLWAALALIAWWILSKLVHEKSDFPQNKQVVRE